MTAAPRTRSRRYRVRQTLGVHHRSRLIVVMIGTLLLFAAVGARLVYLHCFLNEQILAKLLDGQQILVPIPSSRGTIYDRNMRELAISVRSQSLYAVPREIDAPDTVADQLAPILGIPRATVAERLSGDGSFIWIARQLDPAVADRVRALDIKGLHFVPEPRRYYPKSALVAHLVGITGIDGEGLEGLERQYDNVLRGRDGYMVTSRDAKGRPLIPLLNERQEPTGGNHLVLTIDEDLQHVAQDALRRACEQYTPRRGAIVVQDPRTGEILAVANWPEFDPNDFRRSSPELRRNAAFVDVFEPGSVFKLVTAVGALEERVVQPYEVIDCHDGRLPYYGHVIRDVHPIKEATFVRVIEQSSNIGTIEVANRLGIELFEKYMRRLGFLERVGIGFPAEPRGILGKRSRRSMGALPIGQEVAVTALQLAQAFSTVANGGVRMKPRVVRAILSNDGSVVEEYGPEMVRTVCSPQVAQLVTEILCGVVEKEYGTGTLAAIEGYRVAGKTGTAQIPRPGGGGYCTDRHMTVFAGYVPADAPALTIVVVLDSPRTQPRLDTGGRVAAPVFREVAQHSLRIAGIPPRAPEAETAVPIDTIAEGDAPVSPPPDETARRRSRAFAQRTRVTLPLSLANDTGYEHRASPAGRPHVSVIARQGGVATSVGPSG